MNSIVDRVAEVIAAREEVKLPPDELSRLQDFLCRMKEAGVVKRREYDLPHPDTLGRAVSERFQNKPLQS